MQKNDQLYGLEALRVAYLENKDRALEDFFTFLRFSSISSEPAHNGQTKKCVEWLKTYIEDIGFKTELWEISDHHPVLFASWNGAGQDLPTLLIYNHYDVQPVDPLEKWHSLPFEPEIRDGQVFARGAQDNKGQCFYVLQALKLLMSKDKGLPINIKLCIEGEEECGSAGLASMLKEKQDMLKADYLAVVDLGIRSKTKPSLTLGLRGITTLDVEAIGSNSDLHSGMHGGIAYNPIHALVKVLSQLRDENGKIAIPGFYDDVVEMTQEELSAICFKFDDDEYQTMFGIKATGGEKALKPLERNWLRPSLEINGINGGYYGPGFKTVIPAIATAKVSCRIVPNQDPQAVALKIANFLEANAPDGIKIKVTPHHGGGKAVHTKADSTVVQAFAKALEEVFNEPCDFIYEGASIPIVTELTYAAKAELVLLGLGLADDNIHAPNEHFGVDRLEKGCLMMALGIELLRKSQQ